MADTGRFDRGKTIHAMLDSHHQERLASLEALCPDFARYTLEFPFGDVLARPGLTLAQREIVTLSATAALGVLPELKIHTEFALNAGLSREEIMEIMIQLAVYAGWPRASEGLYAVDEVFGRLDAAEEQSGASRSG